MAKSTESLDVALLILPLNEFPNPKVLPHGRWEGNLAHLCAVCNFISTYKSTKAPIGPFGNTNGYVYMLCFIASRGILDDQHLSVIRGWFIYNHFITISRFDLVVEIEQWCFKKKWIRVKGTKMESFSILPCWRQVDTRGHFVQLLTLSYCSHSMEESAFCACNKSLMWVWKWYLIKYFLWKGILMDVANKLLFNW